MNPYVNPYVFAWKAEVNNRKAVETKAEKMEQHIEALEQYNKKLKDRIKALETENEA